MSWGRDGQGAWDPAPAPAPSLDLLPTYPQPMYLAELSA